MSGGFMNDHFTTEAVITVRTAASSNPLGEIVYTNTPRTISGLLVVRPRQVWRSLGLTQDVDGVFMTQDACEDLVDGATLAVGGKVYRNVTKARRDDLWGDTVTRLLLHAEER